MIGLGRLRSDRGTKPSVVAAGVRLEGNTLFCKRLYVGKTTRAKKLSFDLYRDHDEPPVRVTVRWTGLKASDGHYQGVSFGTCD